jgi:hypothetical protein
MRTNGVFEFVQGRKRERVGIGRFDRRSQDAVGVGAEVLE